MKTLSIIWFYYSYDWLFLVRLYNTQVGLKTDFTASELEEISRNRFEIGLVDLEFRNPD